MLITNKKEIDGLPTTALGLAAQRIVSNLFFSKFQHVFAFINGLPLSSPVQFLFCHVLKLQLEKAKLLNYNNYAE
ncbi:hypothetical protein Goklo_025515, partial [Gossypium klotzschianum]|nr:hypothetical protein [Gossypium klotzschianum]